MNNWDYFDNIPEYHPMADANNLYDAFAKARKGSHWKYQVQKFRWNVLSEIRKLQNELLDGSYKLLPYSYFTVHERGKTRAITALQIRDRVVKHVLNDVFLLPHIRPFLIYDNGASLEGKGVSFTRNRLTAHLESFFRETGSNEGYIMTMDFSGYYDNIDHEKAMEIIRKYESDDFAERLVWQAFDSYKVDVSDMSDEEYEAAKVSKFSSVEYRKRHHEKRGEKFLHKSLSVGDQTSQITAILFPTPIDYLVKIVNGAKYYGRYMDDFYIISDNLDFIKELQEKIYKTASDLKIFLNSRKIAISKVKRTFTFLQFRYFLTETGHVVVRINPKTVTRMRRKLKKLLILGVRKEKIESLFRSWISNYRGYMSKIQVSNMVTLFRNLYGGGLDEWMKKRGLL